MDLGTFMAATRRIESGAYEGRYGAIGRPVRGDRARGAYQIMGRNWGPWSAAAGLPGANWRDRAAQDRVAAYWMTEYFKRYGNWELVAAAWYGGGGYANRLAARGYEGPQDIPSSDIRRYVQKVAGYMQEAQGQGWRAPRGFNSQLGAATSWVFPVAGRTEWSKGDYGYAGHGRTQPHNAIDIFADPGTPIVTPVAGKVIGAGSGAKKGGNWVKVLGNDGITYYFAHMKKAPVVHQGDVLQAGAHIGFVGATGSAKGTRPHLHFTMKREGAYINPSTYLTTAQVGGGAYNPMHSGQPRPRMASMMDSFVEQMANSVAGGERTDPTTLESAEGEVIEADEATEEIDGIKIERPDRSVNQEIGAV